MTTDRRVSRRAIKRGRPSLEEGLAIDRAILVAAQNLFVQNGYADTSMEAVAQGAGVAKTTLYARYTDKAALFRAIVSDRLESWSKLAPFDPERPLGSAPELLFNYGVNLLEGLSIPEVSAFNRLIFVESSRFPELSDGFYALGHDRAIRDLAAGLATISRRGGWPLTDGEGIARAFTSALTGWFIGESLARTPTHNESATYVSRLVAIFVGGRSTW